MTDAEKGLAVVIDFCMLMTGCFFVGLGLGWPVGLGVFLLILESK